MPVPLSGGTSWSLATGVATEEPQVPDRNGRLERGCPEVRVLASSTSRELPALSSSTCPGVILLVFGETRICREGLRGSPETRDSPGA